MGGMSTRAAAWLAWSLCAFSLALTALGLLLLALNVSYPNTHIYGPWLDNTLTAISYAPVGALIASRHPANLVGWLLCLFGLVISISHFGAQYAIYALLAQPDSLPAGQAMDWIVSAVKDMPVLSLIFGLSIVGTLAWVVALIAAAITLRRAGASRGPLVLLILAGVFLMGGHPYPAGTLAFGCFFLATAWLELAPGRLTSASQPSRVS
jgi:hypothetical protein